MDTTAFLVTAVRPAMYCLPSALDSIEGQALLLSVALQESDLRHRAQMGAGPARSFYQFEPLGVRGVLEHPASKREATDLLDSLCYSEADLSVLMDAIDDNDVLASGLARLAFLRLPQALPKEGDYRESWTQYIEVWRPGRPRQEKWARNFQLGWSCVNQFYRS